LKELSQNVVVLTEARDVGDDAEVVEGERSVAQLLEVGGPPDEHVVKPGREGDGDTPSYGRGVDRLAVGTLARFFVACETVDAGGIASVEADEASADQVAILLDVEVRDKAVVADVTFGGGIPLLSDLAKVLFQVSDDVFEAGNLGGVLRGAGLNGEGETMDELAELLGRDVRMCVEGSEYGMRGQWGNVWNGGSSWRRGERRGRGGGRRFCGKINGAGRHGGLDRGFLPVGGVIEAKRREESERREVEGVDWGVQFDNVLALTFH